MSRNRSGAVCLVYNELCGCKLLYPIDEPKKKKGEKMKTFASISGSINNM